ncbi:MAG: hypothetical protein RSA29_16660 [Clostridium sp.]|uniref:hypothetical protein n=1 Tax=Clostridium sp. TaxID=1506 RepID=UPI00304ABA63
MIYLDIILKVLGIASLLTFMLIAIWGFVVFNSIYGQLKYSNYILEKISHILNISCLDMQAKKKEETKKFKTPAKSSITNPTDIPTTDNIQLDTTLSNESAENNSN